MSSSLYLCILTKLWYGCYSSSRSVSAAQIDNLQPHVCTLNPEQKVIVRKLSQALRPSQGVIRTQSMSRKAKKGCKTYNTRDSPVVTHPSTSLAIICLSMGERTGSRVFRYLWSYVTVSPLFLLIFCLIAVSVWVKVRS
ncbi:hypothetical protein GE09DRAFT_730975 [Coniochaeta sp. 2T2.1]|nr:hypothetical protein GE09DRAFT_730975 [Coniochaeta sp. 2T2.1]